MGKEFRKTWVVAAAWRYYISILFTLRGFTPCTLIFCMRRKSIQQVLNSMVIQCLGTVFEELDLASYGFTLKYLVTGIEFGNINCKGGWVFADVRSGEWPRVQSIFFQPDSQPIQDMDVVNQVLGYPRVKQGPRNCVFFLPDMTEHAVLAGKPVSEVDDDNEEVERVIGFHFHQCSIEVLEDAEFRRARRQLLKPLREAVVAFNIAILSTEVCYLVDETSWVRSEARR
ncbi:hypothetical protein F5Y16DRAFT_236111 [Xylariaceae sp. FL0255]|nr:hypothetical protein F5Y16DRAFT_236111 [Xylariaceae sp. FL0255]